MSGARRLRPVVPDKMDAAQQEFYEAVVSGRRGERFRDQLVAPDGSLRGPFEFLILDPAVGGPIQRVAEVLRFESTMRDDLRELGIMVVAAWLPSQFEWDSHLPLALAAGVPATLLDALRKAGRSEQPISCDDPVFALVLKAAHQMCSRATVDGDTFAELESEFGARLTLTILTLFSYYSMLGMLLNAYGTESVPTTP